MLFYTIEIIGMVAFAISGALAAVQHRMDMSGAIFLAVLVGNGGGTIRDELLGVPVFWLSQTQYIWIAALTGFIVFGIAYYKLTPTSAKNLNSLLLLFDALGLGVFVVAGTDKALACHLPASMAVLLGMITGIGGGAIRDVLCNDIPVIFRRQLYATPALLGAITYVIGIRYYSLELAIWTAVSVVVVIRCLGLYCNWHLPMLRSTDDNQT
ncbi:MAG: trimeric intracellular cation channel family protein [Gammaproteobacteria bacterium]|nr:trimeric intracellular cation channel family protein [Gammaproteobacteria bacterium]